MRSKWRKEWQIAAQEHEVIGISNSCEETQCSHLEPIAGVTRCGSATSGAAAGMIDGGTESSFCGVFSESDAICVGSRSAGVDGGGRAISCAGATTGPFWIHNAESVDCSNRRSVTTQAR